MVNIYDKLPRPFFVLAPMDDVTDTVFRRIIGQCAPPDLYFTEFVNVDGLQSPGRDQLLKRLRFTLAEQPLIAQIWGKNPENYYKTAKQLADGSLAAESAWQQAKSSEANSGKSKPTESGPKRLNASKVQTFAGIDINMGCPVKAVVRNGCCSALINNRELALEIIQATKEGSASLPISVKTRLGFNEVDLTWHELLLQQKLNALSIHGRTSKQVSNVPADWAKIGEIRQMRDKLSPITKIIGNGDVLTKAHGKQLAERYSLDGVMIGRGVFSDPFIFASAVNGQPDGHSPWTETTKQQRIELYRSHVKLFEQTWANNERKIHTLNKFCKIYINGFDGAKELRERLMSAESSKQLLQILDE